MSVLAGAVLIGLAIGLVGIGGVFLPPLLVAGGLPLQPAIGTSLLTFTVTGIVATIIYAARGGIDWRAAALTSVGSVAGGLIGANLSARLPEVAVSACFAAFLLFAGLSALFAREARAQAERRTPLRAWTLLTCGLFVGAGSGLTGVGGPAILVPLLLLLRVPVSVAVGISQPNQIAASAAGAAGHLLFGTVDLRVAAALSVLAGGGVAVGAVLHRRFHTETLRKIVAAGVIVLGLWLAGHLVLHARAA